eukprot:5836762-Pyramimonas_sp.AAC.1
MSNKFGSSAWKPRKRRLQSMHGEVQTLGPRKNVLHTLRSMPPQFRGRFRSCARKQRTGTM